MTRVFRYYKCQCGHRSDNRHWRPKILDSIHCRRCGGEAFPHYAELPTEELEFYRKCRGHREMKKMACLNAQQMGDGRLARSLAIQTRNARIAEKRAAQLLREAQK